MRIGLALVLATVTLSAASAAEGQKPPVQQVLDQAAKQGKFTLILFYAEKNPATDAIARALRDAEAKRGDQVALAEASLRNPEEKAIVDRFDVSRAPMPLAMVVAPNGVVTGVFPQKVTDANIQEALVTPTMTRAMKAMQQGKIVLVCVQPTAKPVIPSAVKGFEADPRFKDRVSVLTVFVQDPAEGRFLNDMKLAPAERNALTTVLLAPPGVLVGRFNQSASTEDLAVAVHHATHSCNDPNCKDANCKHAPAGAAATRQNSPAVPQANKSQRRKGN